MITSTADTNSYNDLADAKNFCDLGVPGFAADFSALVERYRGKAKDGTLAMGATLSAGERVFLEAHGVPESAGLAAKANALKRARQGR